MIIRGFPRSRLLILSFGFGLLAYAALAQAAQVSWRDCLKQKPEWYASSEAARIADNLLLYQRDSGGWPKNLEMALPLGDKEKAELVKQKHDADSTIDNGATYSQMAYLALVFNAGKQSRFKDSFIKGLDYLLKAQYDNGGWPQFYPKQPGYYSHVTFNDDAMIGVMSLLRDVARESAYLFVDGDRRASAGKAVQKGVACILKCQVLVNGKRTVWCAQHDEITLSPAAARTYEKISLSGGESVGIVRFLMKIENPSPQIIDAVQSAVAWFNRSRIDSVKIVRKPDTSLSRGYDMVVVKEANTEPVWARFYEIGSNRPIFCGRDGVIKYSLADIEYERRTGYRWYVTSPAKLLNEEYPAWRRKWGLATAL